MKYLNSNVDFKKYINEVCIYTKNLEKWSNLKNKNDIIYGIYNNKQDVKTFIEQLSTKDIKSYPSLKNIITYQEYTNNYKNIHERISLLYGEVTVESLSKYYEEKKLKMKEQEIVVLKNYLSKMPFVAYEDLSILENIILY